MLIDQLLILGCTQSFSLILLVRLAWSVGVGLVQSRCYPVSVCLDACRWLCVDYVGLKWVPLFFVFFGECSFSSFSSFFCLYFFSPLFPFICFSFLLLLSLLFSFVYILYLSSLHLSQLFSFMSVRNHSFLFSFLCVFVFCLVFVIGKGRLSDRYTEKHS